MAGWGFGGFGPYNETTFSVVDTPDNAPYVRDAPAVLECTLFKEVDLGDAPNTLVIGEVRAVRLDRSLRVDDETLHVEAPSLRPIGRLGLDEYTLLGEMRHVPRPRVPGSR